MPLPIKKESTHRVCFSLVIELFLLLCHLITLFFIG